MMRPTILALATSTEPELIFIAGFNPKTRFSCLVLQALGEAVAPIIERREKHYFALYPQVSVETPMSYSEMFGVVKNVVEKPVKVQQWSFEDDAVSALLQILTSGVRDVHQKRRAAAERMLLVYNDRGLVGNPVVLEMVLGREGDDF